MAKVNGNLRYSSVSTAVSTLHSASLDMNTTHHHVEYLSKK